MGEGRDAGKKRKNNVLALPLVKAFKDVRLRCGEAKKPASPVRICDVRRGMDWNEQTSEPRRMETGRISR